MIELPPFDPEEQQTLWEYTAALGEADYVFRIEWRERVAGWYLDWEAADGTFIARGKRLSVDWPIAYGRVFDPELLPAGQLMLWDVSGSHVECGFEDLGRRCVLIFAPDGELQQLPEPAIVIGRP